MILTSTAIKAAWQQNEISISPFEESLLNPNSYNYRLGADLLIPNDEVLDPYITPSYKEIIIPSEGIELQPNVLYLGHTHEIIGSEKYVPSLIGRSSVGRLGIFLQITADLGQIGNAHQWTLEIRVVQPVRVYPLMRIGQISFWVPTGDTSKKYSGGYSLHNKPRGHMTWEKK